MSKSTEPRVQTLSSAQMRQHLAIFPRCEYLCPHNIKLAEEGTPQCFCPSYYDDDGTLQDCECGECK